MKQFELEDLVFRRSSRFALAIDDFSLEGGEKVAVVGPNGSGKTTLLRILSFLEQPDSWASFLFRGRRYAPGEMDRTGLGFLQQQPLLFHGTVADNLAYPLKLQRMSSTTVGARLDSMLAQMEIDHLTGAPARHLSVGEQRRLALGRVLIAGPETLLLDEPTAHLDASSRTVIEDILVRADQTILLTTHDLQFAHRVADRVLTLRAGRMSIGLSVNVFEGKVEEGCFVTEHGLSIALPDTSVPTGHGPSRAIIDPRDLVLSLGPPGAGAENQLKGHVSSIREQGDDVWLEIDCGHRVTAIVSRGTYEKEALNLHREVYLSFNPDGVEVL